MHTLLLTFGSKAPLIPYALLTVETGEADRFSTRSFHDLQEDEDLGGYDCIVVPYMWPSEEDDVFRAWHWLERRRQSREGGVPVVLPVGYWPGDTASDDLHAARTMMEAGLAVIGATRPRILPPVLPHTTPDMGRRILAGDLSSMPLFTITGQRLFAMLKVLAAHPEGEGHLYERSWRDICSRLRLTPYGRLLCVARLLEDQMRLHGGGRPDDRTLEQAALIDNWQLVPATEYRLTGDVENHPRGRDGRGVHTAPIVMMDEEHGWARSLNTFYRLGTPRAERALIPEETT